MNISGMTQTKMGGILTIFNRFWATLSSHVNRLNIVYTRYFIQTTEAFQFM
jgi:hypothetical protein